MLLAIDAGNTNIVFAVHDGERIRGQWRASTSDARTADEYFVWFSNLMAFDGLDPAGIEHAVISTVVPQARMGLESLCRRFLDCEAMVVGDPAVALPLEVRIERPSEVGADRLVNAVAAHRTYGGPLIVVDFGTATTLDIVDGDGGYAGGVIAPGINLSMRALHMAAAQLPNVAVERPARVIGKSTVGAMQSGVFWGYVGLVEGLVERVRTEFGAPMKVIATGGLAPVFRAGTRLIEHEDPDLTIRGLVEIHRYNRPSSGPRRTTGADG